MVTVDKLLRIESVVTMPLIFLHQLHHKEELVVDMELGFDKNTVAYPETFSSWLAVGNVNTSSPVLLAFLERLVDVDDVVGHDGPAAMLQEAISQFITSSAAGAVGFAEQLAALHLFTAELEAVQQFVASLEGHVDLPSAVVMWVERAHALQQAAFPFGRPPSLESWHHVEHASTRFGLHALVLLKEQATIVKHAKSLLKTLGLPAGPLWYHGTSHNCAKGIVSDGVDTGNGRVNLDFGRGFYVASKLEEAVVWATRRGHAAILVYDTPELGEEEAEHVFTEVDSEWKACVTAHRLRQSAGAAVVRRFYSQMARVTGPVALSVGDHGLVALGDGFTQCCVRHDAHAKLWDAHLLCVLFFGDGA